LRNDHLIAGTCHRKLLRQGRGGGENEINGILAPGRVEILEKYFLLKGMPDFFNTKRSLACVPRKEETAAFPIGSHRGSENPSAGNQYNHFFP
jgi:hypothetical protein